MERGGYPGCRQVLLLSPCNQRQTDIREREGGGCSHSGGYRELHKPVAPSRHHVAWEDLCAKHLGCPFCNLKARVCRGGVRQRGPAENSIAFEAAGEEVE